MDSMVTSQNSDKAFEFREKAIVCSKDKKQDSAFFYFDKAKSLFDKVKDSLNSGYCLSQMAEIQQTYGDYAGSEETVTELLSYKLPNYNAAAYNLLGIVSKELGNYEDAIKWYTTAMKSAKELADKQSPLNNIAAVYMEQNKYEKAIPILNEILKTHLLDTFQKRKARVIDNLGFAYHKANQQSKGLDLMNQSLTKRISIKDSYGSIESYLHLADYYQDKDFSKFKTNALEAYKTATITNSVDERLEALQFLMSYNQQKGENKYAIQFNVLNDSIRKVRNNDKNQFAKIKYDSKEAKENEAEAELNLERQINQNNYYIGGILFLIVSIVYVFTSLRNRNKREKAETVYKVETRISKQLHDELANDVFHTMTFAETQDLQNPDKKEEFLNNLDKIYNQTRNISSENSSIDTGENFEDNLKGMISSYNSDVIKIIIRDNKDIDWVKIQREKKIAVQRVLQELLVNMKKHSQCNLTVIGFTKNEKNIEIQYSDNGKGVVDGVHLKNGLHNVENRIHGIKGTITFESELGKGFKVKISFPK